jgi:ADP-ribose pyrophosphatase
MPSPDGGFRFLGERTRYAGSFFSLTTGTFLDPGGYTFERDIVRHPGAVCVVPLDADDKILMLRQYRGSVDRHILELPAGKLDVPGEVTEEAARRELAEETGRIAGRVTELGYFFNSPGFTDEATTCYLAEDLIDKGRATQGVEEDHMTIELVALADVWNLQTAGELIDGKSLIALALTERLLASRREVI